MVSIKLSINVSDDEYSEPDLILILTLSSSLLGSL